MSDLATDDKMIDVETIRRRVAELFKRIPHRHISDDAGDHCANCRELWLHETITTLLAEREELRPVALAIVAAVNPILNEHRTQLVESSAEAVTRVIAERDALRQQVVRLRELLSSLLEWTTLCADDLPAKKVVVGEARAALKETEA